MKKPFLIGITGGSASGKTVFINELIRKLPKEQVCVVSQDHYYKKIENQPIDNKGVENFDLPESFNLKEFVEDIRKLKQGETIQREEYTYNNPLLKPGIVTIQPAPVIIIEGLFVFYEEEILNIMDLKVFIEAKPHIKLKRRIIRDNEERGYDLDDVLYRFEKHVIPTYERYILPYRDSADIIIPNNNGFTRGLNVVASYLMSVI
jgi:uridine kinase